MTFPAPDADAAEQQQPVVPEGEGALPNDVPLEADPADAAEQALEVPHDEDEGRD